MSRLDGPRPLRSSDDLRPFQLTDIDMDDWIRTQVERARASRSSRTFVVSDLETGRVVGYCWLTPHFVVHTRDESASRLPLPVEPVPVVLLGRIAVAADHQRRGLGSALLKDALRRAFAAAPLIGARAVLAHAAFPELGGFYARYGFRTLPSTDGQGMYLPLPLDNAATTRTAA